MTSDYNMSLEDDRDAEISNLTLDGSSKALDNVQGDLREAITDEKCFAVKEVSDIRTNVQVLHSRTSMDEGTQSTCSIKEAYEVRRAKSTKSDISMHMHVDNRRVKFHNLLWLAYEDGIVPRTLMKTNSCGQKDAINKKGLSQRNHRFIPGIITQDFSDPLCLNKNNSRDMKLLDKTMMLKVKENSSGRSQENNSRATRPSALSCIDEERLRSIEQILPPSQSKFANHHKASDTTSYKDNNVPDCSQKSNLISSTANNLVESFSSFNQNIQHKSGKKKGHRRHHSLPIDISIFPTEGSESGFEVIPSPMKNKGKNQVFFHNNNSPSFLSDEKNDDNIHQTNASMQDPLSDVLLHLTNQDNNINDKGNKKKGNKQHKRTCSLPVFEVPIVFVPPGGEQIDERVLKNLTEEEKKKTADPFLLATFPDEKGLKQDPLEDRMKAAEMLSNASIFECDHDGIDSMVSWETKNPEYSAWSALKDEYSFGYGYKKTLPFKIIGTYAEDTSCQPHVLSPPLMESLQSFLPDSRMRDNFWLKFSLVRDGASLTTLLQNIRGSHHTIVAIETTDGQVFGSFASTPWRKTRGFFGNGECFVWRMRKSRLTQCYSILDQARLESEIEVFTNSRKNDCFQACNDNMIAIGGNATSPHDDIGIIQKTDESTMSDTSGFAIAVTDDLSHGTTSPCPTFDSPCLIDQPSQHEGLFEIFNLEVYTFTPFTTEKEAERSELGKMFLEENIDLD